MVNILCGLIGVIFAVGLLVVGFWLGVKYEAGRKPEPAAITDAEAERIEKERERLEKEQEAFWQLIGYSADVAYGAAKFPGEGSA